MLSSRLALVTPGALRDHGDERFGDLAGLGGLRHVNEERVGGRGLNRREGAVDRYLLIHLTSDGLLTDIDLVER